MGVDDGGQGEQVLPEFGVGHANTSSPQIMPYCNNYSLSSFRTTPCPLGLYTIPGIRNASTQVTISDGVSVKYRPIARHSSNSTVHRGCITIKHYSCLSSDQLFHRLPIFSWLIVSFPPRASGVFGNSIGLTAAEVFWGQS